MILLCPLSTNTTTAVTRTTATSKKKTSGIEKAPVLVSSRVFPNALGSPATIPAKIIIDIPLPMPRSVICSPNQTKNIVPLTRVITEVNLKAKPGSRTRPGCASSATVIPSA